ncbi:hypothetical protein [Mesorhizobium mediterraneum]|uniref:hypothetical protein n=1 Tax=Mesorhizobium mediterraneum TaxID=43617 RepID=UPI001782C66D|nr:hypothetical protein [Mesorhizobium mediterraneum]
MTRAFIVRIMRAKPVTEPQEIRPNAQALRQLHFRVTPLGIAMNIHGEEIVAALASFDHRTLTRLQEVRTDARRPEHVRRSVFANWPNEFQG